MCAPRAPRGPASQSRKDARTLTHSRPAGLPGQAQALGQARDPPQRGGRSSTPPWAGGPRVSSPCPAHRPRAQDRVEVRLRVEGTRQIPSCPSGASDTNSNRPAQAFPTHKRQHISNEQALLGDTDGHDHPHWASLCAKHPPLIL